MTRTWSLRRPGTFPWPSPGGRRAGAEVDAGKAAADAVGEVLAYYRVKPADAPRDPKSVRDLIDAQLRGTGVMCRRVVLSKGWQRDAAGAMLGFVDGACR